MIKRSSLLFCFLLGLSIHCNAQSVFNAADLNALNLYNLYTTQFVGTDLYDDFQDEYIDNLKKSISNNENSFTTATFFALYKSLDEKVLELKKEKNYNLFSYPKLMPVAQQKQYTALFQQYKTLNQKMYDATAIIKSFGDEYNLIKDTKKKQEVSFLIDSLEQYRFRLRYNFYQLELVAASNMLLVDSIYFAKKPLVKEYLDMEKCRQYGNQIQRLMLIFSRDSAYEHINEIMSLKDKTDSIRKFYLTTYKRTNIDANTVITIKGCFEDLNEIIDIVDDYKKEIDDRKNRIEKDFFSSFSNKDFIQEFYNEKNDFEESTNTFTSKYMNK